VLLCSVALLIGRRTTNILLQGISLFEDLCSLQCPSVLYVDAERILLSSPLSLGCCFDEGIVLGFVVAGGKWQPWKVLWSDYREQCCKL
jgi:hypothetical protein